MAIFLEPPPQQKTNNAFLVSNFSFFIFSKNFAIRQIGRGWLQIRHFFFQICAQKYQNNSFFVPNLGIIFFSRNFAVRQIWRCWYHIWQNYLQILAQKKPNQTFLVSNWNIFIFTPNLATRQVQDADFKYENIFLKLQPKNTQIRHCSFLF